MRNARGALLYMTKIISTYREVFFFPLPTRRDPNCLNQTELLFSVGLFLNYIISPKGGGSQFGCTVSVKHLVAVKVAK